MLLSNWTMSEKNIFNLKDKIAVVTGGAGNLGPVWAKALQSAGAKIALIDLPASNKKNQKIYECNITDKKALSKAHSQINKELGFVSILVNNAGIDAPPGVNLKDHSQIWQINVEGAVNCISEFVKDMQEQKKGSIINIGSLYLERSPDEKFYSHLNSDKPWAYGATKAAVHSITCHYATRLAKYGIRVNTLSPGGVLNNQDREFVRKYSARVPLGRMAQKEKDLAGPLIFLASNASSYVTGINLQVNGGYTAW